MGDYLQRLQENDSDPFLHAAYADRIEDNVALQKFHYFRAITLYGDGCVSDWHLKYVNCLILLGEERRAYLHIAKYHSNIRGFDNLILIKAANYQFRHKNYVIAIKLYEKINNNMIWRKRLNGKLGICYKNIGQFNESTKYLKRHLRQTAEDKKSIITLINLASVYCHKLKYKKALTIYTKKLNKKDILRNNLLKEIGICYFQINDYEMSLFYFNKQLNILNENENENENNSDDIKPICLFYRGLIYSRKCEMYQEALTCFKCIDYNLLPLKYGSIDNEIGFCYFKLKKFDLSLKYYTKYTIDNPSNSWFSKVNMAIIYTKRGNHRKSLEIYKNVLTMINKSKLLTNSQKNHLKNNKLKLSLLFGATSYNLGHYKNSLKYYLSAINLKSIKTSKTSKTSKSLKSALNKITYIYHKKLNKYHKAIKYFDKLEKLGEINKHNMELQFAKCLEKLERYNDAFKIMQRYLNKFPDSIYCLNAMVTVNMMKKGGLGDKYNNLCHELIQKAISIDANSLHTNYIYTFHLNIIRKEYHLTKQYLNITQSLFVNNHHRETDDFIDIETCIDIAKLYTLIDIQYGEYNIFEKMGLNYFNNVLSRYPDNIELNILYGIFLCRFNKLELLDLFHTKLMNKSYIFSTNLKFVFSRIRKYAFELNKIGRIDFVMDIMKTINDNNNNNNNNNGLILKNMAILYEMKKDYVESGIYFKKSLNFDTMDFEGNLFYADLLYKMGEIVDGISHFKIAFCDNSKHKKTFNIKYIINYSKAMCMINDYKNCVQDLLRISQEFHHHLNDEKDQILIYRLIIEIYGKINYEIDFLQSTNYLQHLTAIYKHTSHKSDNHSICCCII